MIFEAEVARADSPFCAWLDVPDDILEWHMPSLSLPTFASSCTAVLTHPARSWIGINEPLSTACTVINVSSIAVQSSPYLIVSTMAGLTQCVNTPTVAIFQADINKGQSAEPRADVSFNSTAQKQRSAEISRTFTKLLLQARDEIFEDGIESNFSKQLLSSVGRFGTEGVELLTELVVSEQANAEISSEALRWIGNMQDPATHQSRLWLLGRSLRSSSPKVRDAAALGLAFLNDPQAIPLIEEAIENERIEDLRLDMTQIVEELRHAT